MSFKSLGLSEPLLRAVSKKGYETPSPIQVKAIPPILEGKDILLLHKRVLEKQQVLLYHYYTYYPKIQKISIDL